MKKVVLGIFTIALLTLNNNSMANEYGDETRIVDTKFECTLTCLYYEGGIPRKAREAYSVCAKNQTKAIQAATDQEVCEAGSNGYPYAIHQGSVQCKISRLNNCSTDKETDDAENLEAQLF